MNLARSSHRISARLRKTLGGCRQTQMVTFAVLPKQNERPEPNWGQRDLPNSSPSRLFPVIALTPIWPRVVHFFPLNCRFAEVKLI